MMFIMIPVSNLYFCDFKIGEILLYSRTVNSDAKLVLTRLKGIIMKYIKAQ